MDKEIFVNWINSAITAYNLQGDERGAQILQEIKDKAAAGAFDGDISTRLQRRPDVATRADHDERLRGWFGGAAFVIPD